MTMISLALSPCNPVLRPSGPPRIAPPSSDFDWLAADLGISVYDADGVVIHNYDPLSVKPVITGTTFYLDPVSGSNTNNGTTPATPRKTLASVSGLVNAASASLIHRVMFKGGLDLAAITVQFNRSVVLESWDGERLITVAVPASTPPTWAKTAGQTNVYEITPNTSQARMAVVDVSAPMSRAPATPDYPAYAPRFRDLASVADVGTCDSTPNSFYYDSVTPKLYVHTFDSRAADANVLQIATSGGVAFAAASGVSAPTFWAEKISSVGGGVSINCTETFIAGGVPAYRAYLNQCTGQSGNQDGISHHGLGMTVDYQCGAYATRVDGFSLWGMNAASNTDPTGNRVGIESFADQCGIITDGTTNSSTQHSLGRTVSINCDERNALDRNIQDINFSKRWWLGGVIGPSRTPTGNASRSLVAGNANSQNTEIWVDGATFLPGSLYDLSAWGGCTIYFKEQIPPGLTIDPGTIGTVTTY